MTRISCGTCAHAHACAPVCVCASGRECVQRAMCEPRGMSAWCCVGLYLHACAIESAPRLSHKRGDSTSTCRTQISSQQGRAPSCACRHNLTHDHKKVVGYRCCGRPAANRRNLVTLFDQLGACRRRTPRATMDARRAASERSDTDPLAVPAGMLRDDLKSFQRQTARRRACRWRQTRAGTGPNPRSPHRPSRPRPSLSCKAPTFHRPSNLGDARFRK